MSIEEPTGYYPVLYCATLPYVQPVLYSGSGLTRVSFAHRSVWTTHLPSTFSIGSGSNASVFQLPVRIVFYTYSIAHNGICFTFF